VADAYLNISCARWDELPQAVTALAGDLLTRVVDLQNQSGRNWDYFRLEIWEDSGRIIAFPAYSRERFRVDVAGCQITCAEIEADLERLISLELPDDTYEQRATTLVRRVAHFVRTNFPDHFTFAWRLFDQDGQEYTPEAT
jgi:hypothetical protein